MKRDDPSMAVLKKRLSDKLWRLQNLYHIKDAETGRIIKFVPRPEQMTIFEALEAGVRKIIILKARRLGMSTAIDVFAADEATFNAGVQVSIVDKNQDDAAKKLNTIVKVAIDNLHPEIFKRCKFPRSNDSALEIQIDDTISTISAATKARGGTNQLLHISEWGVIQADDPKRSEEILTGSLPSAEHGVTIVETTWKGGRGGHLWRLVKRAMETPEDQRTDKDWRLFFFPWWRDPTYTIAGNVANIDQETVKYLSEKEEELGIKFTPGQKLWYAQTRADIGMFIYREFPTTVDECFRAPIEGAIYAQLLDRIRSEGGISNSRVDGSALVHTFWDLGSPMNTVTWYAQIVGNEIRIIDCDMELDMTPVERAAHILRKGYNLGFHYLPHDAAATERSGRTFQGEMEAAGLKNTRVLPRTHDIWIGINRTRQLMPRMSFRIPACERGLEALTSYHALTISGSGIAKDEPVHDWSSHAADALRSLAEAEMAGLLQGGSSIAVHSRRRSGGTVMRVGASSAPRSRVKSVLDRFGLQ